MSDKRTIFEVADGPEGIHVYESEERAVCDWSCRVPAAYVDIVLNGASASFGPFQVVDARRGNDARLDEGKIFPSPVDWAAVEQHRWIWMNLLNQLRWAPKERLVEIVEMLGGHARFADKLEVALRDMIGPVAQRTERDPSKIEVAGSNPAGLAIDDVCEVCAKSHPNPDCEVAVHWTEKVSWLSTDRKHVMLCVDTLKYHFVDEAEQLDERPYDTIEECEAALQEYARTL